MSSEAFTQIILAIIALLGTIVTTVLIPYIKSKLTTEELSKLMSYIAIGVRAAEQLFNTDEGHKKKEYVKNYITGILNDKLQIKLSDEQIDTIIEGTVQEIKKGSDLLS